MLFYGRLADAAGVAQSRTMVAAAHRRATEAREQAPHRAVVGTGQDARSHNELLKCLEADDLREFRNVARPAPLLRSAVLHRSGEPLQWIHFVEEGLVSLRSYLEDGRDIETHTVGPEGAVGLLEALGSGMASVQAHVTLPGVAWRISVTAFEALMLDSPLFKRAVAQHLETVIDDLQQGLVCHAVHGIDQRLCRWLLDRSDRLGGAANVPATHACLASGLGVQRTSISESMQRLQAAGLVATKRGVVTLLDPPGLEHRSCVCRQTLVKRQAIRRQARL